MMHHTSTSFQVEIVLILNYIIIVNNYTFTPLYLSGIVVHLINNYWIFHKLATQIMFQSIAKSVYHL